jgi:hypothetical protein
MRILPQRRSLVAFVLLVAAITAVKWTVEAANSRQDRNEVAKMTKQLKTICAGRFLIDLPQDAQVSLSKVSIDGFDVVTDPNESDSEFRARVSRRERELKEQVNDLGEKSLESAQDIRGDDRSGRIFVFDRISTYLLHGDKKIVLNGVSAHAFLRTGGISYTFIANLVDPKLVGNLPRVIAKLRPLAQDEQPRGPGFCINRGLIADPLTAEQAERVVLFAGLPNHPDLSIVFSSMAGTTPGPGLLARNAENRAQRFAFLGGLFTTLREGQRQVNGMPGEELAVRVREINFASTYGFNWEMAGTEDNVLKPFVSLELSTGINPQAGGPPVQSTLSESALNQLWESVLTSIRIRPAAEPKAAKAGAATATPGSFAMAGETCPETGWWKCDDGGNGVRVLGGTLQYLKKGQRMPQALLLPPQTLWQKVRGLQPSYENKTPTDWKLVDRRQRPRTVSPVPLAAATPPDQDQLSAAPVRPLGTYARTGETCPASGWWRCEDPRALDGTRWFAQGSLLPVATFRLGSGVFDKARGAPEVIQRRINWQLVRHAPGPEAGSDAKAGQESEQANVPPTPARASSQATTEGARET